jgi:hypothetical protein
MSVLVTGDLHLSANPRDAYRWAAMGVIAGLIQEHKVETLIVLGDLTEQKDHHGAGLVNDIVELLFNLTCLCLVIINKGNHDYVDADCPYFMFTRRLERLQWVNKPCWADVVGLGPAIFLPHTLNHKRDWANLDWTRSDLIFAHQTFDGADVGHGYRVSGIPLDVFSADAKIISGDIHTPQTLRGRLTYVGAPYTVDFGDDYEPRVLLLRDNLMAPMSFSIPGPQKRLLTWKNGLSVTGVEYKEGDIVKVRYQLDGKERDQWPAIKADIRKTLTERGCKIDSIQPIFDGGIACSIAPTTQAKSDEQVVRDFAKAQKLDEAVGLELTREA